MKHILKGIIIFGLMLLLLPVSAMADAMAKDDFAQVSCGNVHTLALRNNGDLWAWGANEEGQIGNGGASDSVGGTDSPCQAEPVLVLDGVTAIAAGAFHSLAIREDGSLWGWGMNAMGQLGLAGDKSVLAPAKLMDEVAAVAAGFDFTMVLKQDGSLWACGNQEAIRLSAFEDEAENPNEPVQVMEQVKAVAAGYLHVLAVKEDGSLWAWGYNEQGQVGIGVADAKHLYQEEPAQIFESGVVSVAAGHNNSLAIMEDGALWGWGNNHEQNLLESKDDIIAAPHLLLEGVQLADAAMGRTLAIKEDGNLWGWGNNYAQALNFNYRDDEISGVPRKIMDNVIAVSSSGDHTMAVKTDGTLWGWGNNDFGQLTQLPETQNLALPVRVKVEYPAEVAEPEPEAEPKPTPEPEPTPAEPERPSPLPFIIGCGVLGAGGVTGGLVWRHKKRKGGVSAWRE